jgi:hypothetical protein
MKYVPINLCYVVSKFKHHAEFKEQILDAIENEVIFNFKNNTSNIKTDWGSYVTKKRKYYSIIEQQLNDHMLEVYKNMGYNTSFIHNSWFQQYYQTGKHGWHTHLACQWTNVYYVELPDNTPRTEMIHPYTQESIVIDVEEGDILTFPSLVLHRAPEVVEDTRKTIISFNSDSGY